MCVGDVCVCRAGRAQIAGHHFTAFRHPVVVTQFAGEVVVLLRLHDGHGLVVGQHVNDSACVLDALLLSVTEGRVLRHHVGLCGALDLEARAWKGALESRVAAGAQQRSAQALGGGAVG